MENHRICCVCLTNESKVEGETKFAPVLKNNIAEALYNISAIQPVEWANGTPTLICPPCENDVISADFVRLQVIKGQKHLAEMNAKTEVKMIHKNRKDLVLKNPSFPYVLSKSTLEKAEAWKRSQQLLEVLEKADKAPQQSKTAEPAVKAELVSPVRRNSSEVEFVSKKAAIRREKKAAIPVKKFKGKKEKKPLSVIQHIGFHQETVPGIKSEKVKASKPLRFKNVTKRKQVPTSFECDSCNQCFTTFEELNTHMESHNELLDDETEKRSDVETEQLLDDKTDPKPIFDSPPMIISQIHEGKSLFYLFRSNFNKNFMHFSRRLFFR